MITASEGFPEDKPSFVSDIFAERDHSDRLILRSGRRLWWRVDIVPAVIGKSRVQFDSVWGTAVVDSSDFGNRGILVGWYQFHHYDDECPSEGNENL